MLRRSLVPGSVAIVAFAALTGCSSGVGAASGEPPASAPAAASAPAIAKIVTRDRSITLYAGQGAVRATVLDASGKLVAREVDIDALQTIDASAYDACHASFAGQPRLPGAVDLTEVPSSGAPRIGW